MANIVRIGSPEWKRYEDQMARWFASWDARSQWIWLKNYPEDRKKYLHFCKDGVFAYMANDADR